jgi:hypothetical protein
MHRYYHQHHKKKRELCRAPVAHAYNPSYSGNRDQEEGGSKPAQVNSLRNPTSKKPITIKG